MSTCPRPSAVLVIGVLLAAPVVAADLQQKTVTAFDRYVGETERQMDLPGKPFLKVDGLAAADRKKTLDSLQQGGLFIESVKTRANGRDIGIEEGLVHHWVGVVFVPGTTVSQAVALLQDYDHHDDIYKPNVARSKTVSRDGNRFKLSLRFYMKKGITVVVNSDHEAVFTRDAADRASSRIRSTRIAEVENPDTPQERELPVGHDGGYLWRLNSYWRFLERDNGVYVQCESITLTRGIPYGFGWLVGPFVTSLPKETLTFTLETTKKALGGKAAVRRDSVRPAQARVDAPGRGA
jgi:hypothetical protein